MVTAIQVNVTLPWHISDARSLFPLETWKAHQFWADQIIQTGSQSLKSIVHLVDFRNNIWIIICAFNCSCHSSYKYEFCSLCAKSNLTVSERGKENNFLFVSWLSCITMLWCHLIKETMHICMLQDQNCANIFTHFLSKPVWIFWLGGQMLWRHPGQFSYVRPPWRNDNESLTKKKKKLKRWEKSRELNEVTEPHMSWGMKEGSVKRTKVKRTRWKSRKKAV